MNGGRFVYIDYGGSPLIARELRYALATLLAEIPQARVVVYTDRPHVYASLPVTPRALGDDLARWTRGGAFAHRIKICALADALATGGGDCVLIDTDSYIRPGFAAALAAAMAQGVAMDRFERRDPFPDWAGFAADLPGGLYVYDPGAAAMFNSGLVGVRAGRDEAALADALALLDALYDSGRRTFLLEQFAFSECLRRSGLPIAEMAPQFQHYCRRSLKRYMHWRLARFASVAPTRPFIRHPRSAVRAFNWVNRIGGWRA